MKKNLLLTIAFAFVGICNAQQLETYTSSIPKDVTINRGNFRNCKETYTYYTVDDKKIRHGKYSFEDSDPSGDGKVTVSAQYKNGLIDGTVKILLSQGDDFYNTTMNFVEGVPSGTWTSTKNMGGVMNVSNDKTNRVINDITLKIEEGNVVYFEHKYYAKNTGNLRAYGEFSKAKVNKDWESFNHSRANVHEGRFSIRKGVCVTDINHYQLTTSSDPLTKRNKIDETLRKYADGELSFNELKELGYVRCTNSAAYDILEPLQLLVYDINEFFYRVDDYGKRLNYITELLGEAQDLTFEIPDVFRKYETLDSEMFASFLHETGLKQTSIPELQNNPYKFKEYYMTDTEGQFSVYSSLYGTMVLTPSQMEIVRPLYQEKKNKEKEAAERELNEKAEKEKEQCKTIIESALIELKALYDSASKIEQKLGSKVLLANSPNSLYNRFRSNKSENYNSSMFIGFLAPYLPIVSYSIEPLSINTANVIIETKDKKENTIKYKLEGVTLRNDYKGDDVIYIESFDISTATIM